MRISSIKCYVPKMGSVGSREEVPAKGPPSPLKKFVENYIKIEWCNQCVNYIIMQSAVV